MNSMHPDKASGPDGLNPAFFNIFGNYLEGKFLSAARIGFLIVSFQLM